MKTTFNLIFFFVVLTSAMQAQDYSGLPDTSGTLFYHDPSAELDQYYAMPIKRIYYANWTIHYELRETIGEGWCKPVRPFWAGPVWMKKGSQEMMLNEAGDTLVVLDTVSVGGGWKFMQVGSSELWLTRLKDTALFMFNHLDSSRVYEFSLRISGGPVIPHTINGKKVILTSHNGFAQVYDFYKFSVQQGTLNYDPSLIYLAGHEGKGIQVPTYGDIYDFQVGDVFHYRYDFREAFQNHCDPDYVFRRVITQVVPQGSGYVVHYRDSIDQCRITYQNEQLGKETVLVIKEDTIQVRNPNAPLFAVLPGVKDTHLVGQETYNHLYRNEQDILQFSRTLYNQDSCYTSHGLNVSNYTYTFGMGNTDYGWGSSNGFYELELLYYKKGNKTWGKPLYPVSVQEVRKNEDAFVLFPNPATDEVYLTGNDTWPDQLEITQANGVRQILSTEPVDGGVRIALENFHSGIYFLQIPQNQGYVYKKLIIR